jgi:hypothetical protein
MAAITRSFDVSVWQKSQSRWVGLPGRHDEARVRELRAQGHDIRAYAVEELEPGRAERLAEIDRMLSEVRDRCLCAQDRVTLRKALLRRKAQLLGMAVAT